jgi:hypothetical protein
MSKIEVRVNGAALYYPAGMFEDAEFVENDAVLVASKTQQPTRETSGFNAVVDFLKALVARDVAAPAFGSASSLKDREQYEGTLTVQATEGAALVRVYHQQYSELNEEVSAGKYVTASGERTDEPWHDELLMPGEVLQTPVIESNAITIAIYS